MLRTPSVLMLALGALLVGACTSPTPTPEASPTLDASPTSDATPARTPIVPVTSSPTPEPEHVTLPATVWVANVQTGVVTTIREDFDDWFYDASFTDEGNVLVRYWLGDRRTNFVYADDGTLLAETTPPPDRSAQGCVNTDAGAELDGRVYPDVACGLVSPDRTRMTYIVDAGEVAVSSNASVPSWDQWLVDLRTGDTTLLQPGLRHCGGCDGRFGPRWSPSSRYLVVPDLIDQLFLIDAVAGTSTDIAEGNNATEISRAPVWHPTDDRLLRPGPEESTILEDLEAGTSRQLADLPWPASFDATGAFIYSPSWYTDPPAGSRRPQAPVETSIADAATTEVVAALPGAPGWERLWGQAGEPVVAVEDGFVAVLAVSSGTCRGTLVYDPGDLQGTCLTGATAATLSPDTRLVAFARRTGSFGRANYPGGGSINLPRWEIAVHDQISGETTVVAEDAAGHLFPSMTWNAEGTQLLIRWPHAFGI